MYKRQFLYYVPYVTLAVMTFPAIVQATQSPVAGAVALVIGLSLIHILGVNATVRRRLGSEISAACGQLRRDEMNGKA